MLTFNYFKYMDDDDLDFDLPPAADKPKVDEEKDLDLPPDVPPQAL